MGISEEKLDELLNESKAAEDLVSEIEGTLLEFQEDQKRLSLIKQLFAVELAQIWLKLSTGLSNQDEWRSIEAVVDETQKFLQELRKVVLSPLRAELEHRVDTWLDRWDVGTKTSFELFLSNADDEDLNDLSQLLDEIEQIEIKEDIIRKQLSKWLDYQIKRLAQIEKDVTNFSSWLENMRDEMIKASILDDFLATVANTIQYQDDILQLISNKWMDGKRDNLNNINTEQETIGYAAWKESASDEWEIIVQLLSTLKLSLDSLDSGERNIVSGHIERWDTCDKQKIQELMNDINEIIQSRQKIKETQELNDAGFSPDQPTIKAVQVLWNDRPILPNPGQIDDLASYVTGLRQSVNGLESWLTNFSAVSDQLSRMHSNWKNLAIRHNIKDELGSLEAVDLDLKSLGNLLILHNRILEISQRIRQRLKEGLPDDEKAVLEVVLQLIATGQDRLDVIDLKSHISRENYIELLARLMEKNLVHLEVTT